MKHVFFDLITILYILHAYLLTGENIMPVVTIVYEGNSFVTEEEGVADKIREAVDSVKNGLYDMAATKQFCNRCRLYIQKNGMFFETLDKSGMDEEIYKCNAVLIDGEPVKL